MADQNSTLCTLYVVRHGQTDWNVQKLLQGHSDIPLNAEGEKQAQELSIMLKDIHFDRAFSSDLLRAHRTAEIALLEKNIAVQTTNQLRERCFGDMEGKPFSIFKEIDELYKKLSDEERANHKVNPEYESDNEVMSRVITFMREVAVAYPAKNILLATHGGIIRMLLVHLGLIKIDHLPLIQNGCYLKLTSDGVDFFVDELNGIDLEKKYE